MVTRQYRRIQLCTSDWNDLYYLQPCVAIVHGGWRHQQHLAGNRGLFGFSDGYMPVADRDIPQTAQHVSKGWWQRIQHKERKMKTFLKTVSFVNYYNYDIYVTEDAKGMKLYIAEPHQISATRVAKTEEELMVKIANDVKRLVQIKKMENLRSRKQNRAF